MKVGDLIKMPGSCYRDDEEAEAIGVVTRTDSDEYRSAVGLGSGIESRMQRVQIYWIQDKEYSWEPKKWLEVVSEK